MVFSRIIVVIISKSIWKLTLKMVFSIPCCDIQQIFFSWLSKWLTHLSKCSIWNKVDLEMVFCRISAIIKPQPIWKITLKMLFSIPCWECSRFFLSRLSNVAHSIIKTFNSKKCYLEIVFWWTIAVIMPKQIRKIILKMLFSVPCWDIRQIFFVALQSNTLSYQNFQFEIS